MTSNKPKENNMKNFITNLSTSKAAMVVGIAFITSIFIVTLVDDFLLANFVVPGDTEALANYIEANGRLFGVAVVGYLVVLVLDSIIGLALYVVLKPTNKNLASLTAVLRLLYAFTLIIGLFALTFQVIDVYGYASIKLLGYIFFALHIFVLGYSVFKSEYMPKSLGVLLVVASFTYIVFFVDFHLPKTLEAITMSTMAIAELSLSIWLMLKRNELPEN
ncbi:hypothetical protein DKG77_00310 [Flagellimonas aquimarina]|uniref:DUF4386 domain-containing protein n=2 Tax=Flagellimonas aquimarina TaxID=2201895 RepID=A0A316L324_9FLAO|nr:hypothetical protein DKG77_00310 [Allomuricauda koreensis]